jgi:hypothetical protein
MAHITLDAESLVAECLYRCVELSLPSPGNEYERTFGHEALGCGKADASGATSNERYFAGQFLRSFHVEMNNFGLVSTMNYQWLLQVTIGNHFASQTGYVAVTNGCGRPAGRPTPGWCWRSGSAPLYRTSFSALCATLLFAPLLAP